MDQPWLQQYAPRYYEWHRDRQIHYRPLGVVETLFDADNTWHDGRASILMLLSVDLPATVFGPSATANGSSKLRSHVNFALAVLCLSHPVLLSYVEDRILAARRKAQRCMVIEEPGSLANVLAKVDGTLFPHAQPTEPADAADFGLHLRNTGRPLDPSVGCFSIYAVPQPAPKADRLRIAFIWMTSHHISDGVSSMTWILHFERLLDCPTDVLKARAERLINAHDLTKRLPSAQESYFPQIKGSRARIRWFWVITLVLRHVRRPLPTGLRNPLFRDGEIRQTPYLERRYPDCLNYKQRPPNATGSCLMTASAAASGNFLGICKEARTSTGAVFFAMLAVSMHELDVRHHPTVLSSERLPCVFSFPINPRAFFEPGVTAPTEGCVLAFGEGVVLPYLPVTLPVRNRLILLAKIAQRQLKRWQKRPIDSAQAVKEEGARRPDRVLPDNYIWQIEQLEKRLPQERRPGWNPQGAFPAQSQKPPTCEISWVGRHVLHQSARVDGQQSLGVQSGFRWNYGVRSRNDDMLVGGVMRNDQIAMVFSYDADIVEPERADEWKHLCLSLLEPSATSHI